MYYMGGGLKTEILSQIRHLGFITIVLLLLGLIIGVIKKEYRSYTIISIVQIIMIIFLFNQIQNMGTHHSLTLLPSYLFLIFILIVFFEKSPKSLWIDSLIILVLLINFINGIVGTKTSLFTDIPLKVPYQEDYNQLEKVVDWLKENLNQDNTAYMITHTDKYNPDKLRNFLMPDRSIEYYLPYGSAVIGVHKFPVQLFTAKYIITTTPYESISIEYKYEKVFEELVAAKKFNLVKNFDMNNGYQILIYERVQDVDEEEINKYKDIIKEELKQFAELYIKEIEKYQFGTES